MTYRLVTDEEFPGEGVMRCTECGRDLPVGYPYSLSADGMVGDTPMEAVVCVYCGPAQRGSDVPFCDQFSDDDRLRCTLPAGHNGDHVAHDTEGNVAGTWPVDKGSLDG